MQKQALSKIDSYFERSLGPLLIKLQELALIEGCISAYLLLIRGKDYCVANVHHECLIILARTATIATQIRLQTTELLDHCRQSKVPCLLSSLRCKVDPQLGEWGSKRPTHPRKGLILSRNNAALVARTAASLEDPLRSIMQRIAAHGDIE